MRGVPRQRPSRTAYLVFFRGCGVGGVLGGVLFVAWGYIDRPNIHESVRAVTNMFSFVVPALFLAAVVGLSGLCWSQLGLLGWTGIALALCGSALGVMGRVAVDIVYAFFAQREWPTYLSNWLLLMLSGLTLMGVATVRKRPLRGVGALTLTIGVFGWGYYLTDSGAVLEARSVHVSFGLLFSLGWVVLGTGLLAAGVRRGEWN